MIRFGTLFWLVLLSALGLVMYKVKYDVQALDDQLARVAKETLAEQREIHVLHAEWAYLNQPDRLAELNQRFLSLGPILPQQLSRTIADLPFRAVPAPSDAAPSDAATGVAVADKGESGPADRAAPSPPAAMVRPAVFAAAKPAPVIPALAWAADHPQTLSQLFAQISQDPR